MIYIGMFNDQHEQLSLGPAKLSETEYDKWIAEIKTPVVKATYAVAYYRSMDGNLSKLKSFILGSFDYDKKTLCSLTITCDMTNQIGIIKHKIETDHGAHPPVVTDDVPYEPLNLTGRAIEA